jgi:hypothetical protein
MTRRVMPYAAPGLGRGGRLASPDAGRAEGAAQADLGAALEDGDDHDVGDPDAADEQCDGSQAEEQAIERSLCGDLGRECVRREGAGHSRRVGNYLPPRADAEQSNRL